MTSESPSLPARAERRAFAVLAVPGFRPFLATFFLTMMADNIEHVISYWLLFQKFQSAALGGFAVVSHWLPFLAFSVPVGALNDRFDSRRLIQVGGALFLSVSAAWGYLFLSGSCSCCTAARACSGPPRARCCSTTSSAPPS